MDTTFTYDEAKLAELMLYVAMKCERERTFGATKLNKVLFFADFAAVRLFGKPITGAIYQKLQFGPAPIQLMPVRKSLELSGRAAVQNRQLTVGRTQQRLVALRDPDLSMFSAREIALVDEVIDTLRGKNAIHVSDLSHEFLAWKLGELNESIPYELALLPQAPLPISSGEMAWAQQVVASL